MGLPSVVTLVLATADDDGISLSQTPAGAGDLTITGALASGGVATLDVARRVLITAAANESSKTFTIYGTDRNGNTISEAVTGPNATTAYTTQDFKTVTRVAVSAATTGAVKVGTNGVGSSAWLLLNRNAQPFEVGIECVVSGTVNYTVQTTFDDIMGYYTPGVGVVWNTPAVPTPVNDPLLVGSTVNGTARLNTPCQAVRVTMNSGSGTVVMTKIQAGIIG